MRQPTNFEIFIINQIEEKWGLFLLHNQNNESLKLSFSDSKNQLKIEIENPTSY